MSRTRGPLASNWRRWLINSNPWANSMTLTTAGWKSWRPKACVKSTWRPWWRLPSGTGRGSFAALESLLIQLRSNLYEFSEALTAQYMTPGQGRAPDVVMVVGDGRASQPECKAYQ